jgi:hypothetical protein
VFLNPLRGNYKPEASRNKKAARKPPFHLVDSFIPARL